MGRARPHRARDDRPRRRHVYADLPRQDRRGEVHQRQRCGADGGHGRLLQGQGRPAERRHPVGQRARRGGGRGAGGEDVRHQATRRPAGAGRRARRARVPDLRIARGRHSRQHAEDVAVGEEDLVQRRHAARLWRPCGPEGPGRDAQGDRHPGQRRLLPGADRREGRRLHEGQRRPDRSAGPRRHQGQRRHADPHQLQGRRSLRVPAQLAGLRDAAGAQHPRGDERALHAPQQRALPARGHRVAEAGVRRPQQVRGRSEVHARHPDARAAVEGVRDRAAGADRSGQGYRR